MLDVWQLVLHTVPLHYTLTDGEPHTPVHDEKGCYHDIADLICDARLRCPPCCCVCQHAEDRRCHM